MSADTVMFIFKVGSIAGTLIWASGRGQAWKWVVILFGWVYLGERLVEYALAGGQYGADFLGYYALGVTYLGIRFGWALATEYRDETPKKTELKWYACSKCGKELDQLILQARAMEAGLKVDPPPEQCAGGNTHTFVVQARASMRETP